MSKLPDTPEMEAYLNALAEFLHRHVPDYGNMPASALCGLENVWLAIAVNRADFIKVLDKLKLPRKKRVAASKQAI